MNQSNSRTLARLLIPAVAVALAAGLAGCRTNDDDDMNDMYDDRRTDTRDTRPLTGETQTDETLRVSQLERAGVPVEVRPAILNDLGSATITSARAQPTDSGLVYRVNYLRADGTPAEATFSSTGQRVVVPAAPDATTAGERTQGDVDGTPGGAGTTGDPTTRPAGGGTPPISPPPSTQPAGGGTGGTGSAGPQ